MASDKQLREWISDRLVTFLVRPNSVSVQDVITLATECSSACDLVTKLVELGFTSSAETFTFASEIYGTVPRKAICISNDQMQEKVASDDDYSRLHGSKGMLSKVESDSVDDEDQGRANDSGRNVGGATEEEDEEDDDNCSDVCHLQLQGIWLGFTIKSLNNMDGEAYLQQWVTDKLITLLDYPKSTEIRSFALDIHAKVTRRASIFGKLYQEDVVNRDVAEEEVTELYSNTVENNEAHRQKYKLTDMHENAGEEKGLSVVLTEYEDLEHKGNRSPKLEEKEWLEHQIGKPGLKYGCIDKKLSSDDNP